MQNYAEVLEGYLIPAEEGFGDVLKKAGKAIWDKCITAISWLIKKFQELINKIRRRKDNRNTVEEPDDRRETRFKNDIKQMPGIFKEIQVGISIADHEILPQLQRAALKHPPECVDIDEAFSKCDELIYSGLEKLRELDRSAVRYYCDTVDEGSKMCHNMTTQLSSSCGTCVNLLKTYWQIVNEIKKRIKPDYDPNDAEDNSVRGLANNFIHQVQKLSRYEALLNLIDSILNNHDLPEVTIED